MLKGCKLMFSNVFMSPNLILLSQLIRVSQPPKTLDELGDSLELWEKLNSERAATEDRIPPIHEQFGILEKYEVPIPEEVCHFILSIQ